VARVVVPHRGSLRLAGSRHENRVVGAGVARVVVMHLGSFSEPGFPQENRVVGAGVVTSKRRAGVVLGAGVVHLGSFSNSGFAQEKTVAGGKYVGGCAVTLPRPLPGVEIVGGRVFGARVRGRVTASSLIVTP